MAKISENSLNFYADKRWQKIKATAEQHSFFHWDLEFPGIFYDSNGRSKSNPGFDAVIGNPTYVRQEYLKNKELMQLPENNRLRLEQYAIPAKMDLSGHFYYHSLNALRLGGRLGFITSDSWLSRTYGNALQQTMIDVSRIIVLLRTKFNIFEADVKTVITMLERSELASYIQDNVVKFISVKERSGICLDMDCSSANIEYVERRQSDLKGGNWNLQ